MVGPGLPEAQACSAGKAVGGGGSVTVLPPPPATPAPFPPTPLPLGPNPPLMAPVQAGAIASNGSDAKSNGWLRKRSDGLGEH